MIHSIGRDHTHVVPGEHVGWFQAASGLEASRFLHDVPSFHMNQTLGQRMGVRGGSLSGWQIPGQVVAATASATLPPRRPAAAAAAAAGCSVGRGGGGGAVQLVGVQSPANLQDAKACPPEPGGSARCYWNGYGTQCSHPAQ